MAGSDHRRRNVSAAESDHSLLAPELVGREQDLAALDAALSGAVAGNGRVIVVAGDAGIGKTAVLRSFVGRALAARAHVLVGECREAEAARPFGPFVELLRSAIAKFPMETQRSLHGDASELERFLPQRAGAGAAVPASSAAERYRSHESFAALFADLGRSEPLVLAIEDLHWADSATLELVPYLARKLRSQRVLIVGTYRSDEMHRLHPLRRVLADLDRLPQTMNLRLGLLTAAQAGTLAQAALGQARPLAPEFRASLHDICEGNPLFIEEVLKTLAQRGDLVRRDSGWERSTRGCDLVIPDSVRAAVDQRVYALTPDARKALQVAAVIGRRFGFDLLRQVSGLPERALLDALASAVEAQLIVEEDRADQFAFRHALTREAVLAGLLQRERRLLHGAVAEALERRASSEAAAVADALAYHFDEAGEPERALPHHVVAANEAARVFGFSDAVRHLDRACAIASADQRTLASLHAQLAHAAYLASEPRRALQAAETAQAMFESVGDPAGVADALIVMAYCQMSLGDHRTAAKLGAAAVAAAEPGGASPALAEAHYVVAYMAVLAEDTAAMLQHGEAAIADARACGADRVLVLAMTVVGAALSQKGRRQDGLAMVRDAIRIAVERGEVTAADSAYNMLVFPLRDLGAPRIDVRAAYDEGLRYSSHHGYWHEHTRQRQIDLAFFDGDWDRLLRLVADLHETFWNASPRLLAAFVRAAREGPHMALGPALEARERLLNAGRPEGVAHAAGSAALQWLAGDEQATLKDAAIFADLLASPEAILRLNAWGNNQPLIGPVAMFALLAAERLGDAASIDRWSELMTRDQPGPEPKALSGARAFALARRAARAGDLGGALSLLVETARHLEEGDMPFGLTVTRLERAELLLRRGGPGDREAAAAELALAIPYWRTAKATWYLGELRRWARARHLPFPEPAAPSAAQRGLGPASVLSRREQEVAQLVALGMTNAQIAERLTISERTAEGHVEHIRNKLGFHSRVQIGAWVAGAFVGTDARSS